MFLSHLGSHFTLHIVHIALTYCAQRTAHIAHTALVSRTFSTFLKDVARRTNLPRIVIYCSVYLDYPSSTRQVCTSLSYNTFSSVFRSIDRIPVASANVYKQPAASIPSLLFLIRSTDWRRAAALILNAPTVPASQIGSTASKHAIFSSFNIIHVC